MFKWQNVRFTVAAIIEQIDTKRPWFFEKCFDCGSKILGRYPHAQCKQPASGDDLLYRYPITHVHFYKENC